MAEEADFFSLDELRDTALAKAEELAGAASDRARFEKRVCAQSADPAPTPAALATMATPRPHGAAPMVVGEAHAATPLCLGMSHAPITLSPTLNFTLEEDF